MPPSAPPPPPAEPPPPSTPHAYFHCFDGPVGGSICSSQRDSPACKGSGECYEFDVTDFPNHAWDCSGNVPQAAA